MPEKYEPYKRKVTTESLYFIVFGILVLSISCFLAFKFFVDTYDSRQMIIEERGQKLSRLIDYEIAVRSHSVKSMKLMAEQFLDKKVSLSFNIIDYLIPVKRKNGFTLNLPEEYLGSEIGNITGTGGLPKTGSLKADEIAMSLYLTPLFKTVIERFPGTPWVYYTSLNGFIYLYPKVGIDDFFFSEKLYQMDFIEGALPESNPGGEVFWTNVYTDEAGKGLMVTVSAPVVRDGAVTGSVSTDISVSQLEGLLSNQDIPFSEFYLMSKEGLTLAGTSNTEPDIIPTNFPSGKMISSGNNLITVFNLSVDHWYLVIQTNRTRILLNAFRHASPFVLLVIFLFIGLILILQLQKALSMVQELSTKDALTDLWNRRIFNRVSEMEFSRICRQNSTLGLLIFDIDNFKQFNDTYGHYEGDITLIKVASAIKEALRRNTDNVFRVGGEEFVALTLAESEKKLETEAESARKMVENLNIPHKKGPHRKVTISVGAVLVKGESDLSFDRYYQLADEALYHSKRKGKNMVSVWSTDSKQYLLDINTG